MFLSFQDDDPERKSSFNSVTENKLKILEHVMLPYSYLIFEFLKIFFIVLVVLHDISCRQTMIMVVPDSRLVV